MTEDLRCRECGQSIRYQDASWAPVERQRAYFGDVAAPAVPFAEYEKQTPARPAATGADVAVPMLQALISGVAVSLLGVATLLASGGDPRWAFVVGAGVAAVVWFQLLADSRRLLRVTERIIGADLDGDGAIGDPEPEEVAAPEFTVRLKVDEGDGTTRYAHLPIELAKLQTVARRIAQGDTFTVTAMTGRGQPLSRGEFETLRSWLLRSGYAAWIDEAHHAAGLEFTKRGEAFWRALAGG